ncbi:hypothetical protein PFNF54_05573 [Plasmodium falciparum NF54]|uniref:Uncharacterized protein n=1 Tax=Plasmodium falciparum (isolate NF54) TaxID=5843 RepID=W7JXQ9_PLAFO|nr:hypothetical protein PFNF54_05573 [Plasmodium falciparum NF54]
MKSYNIHVESSVENLLSKLKEKKKRLKGKKDIINDVEYYIGILSNINLKHVYNENYKLIGMLLKILMKHKIYVETIILDRLLQFLNLKNILEKDNEINIRYINNILVLINNNESVHLNSNTLFNIMFDTCIMLIDIFVDNKIYSDEKKSFYTLNMENEKEEDIEIDTSSSVYDHMNNSDDSINNHSDDSINNHSDDSINNHSDDSINNHSDDSINNLSGDSIIYDTSNSSSDDDYSENNCLNTKKRKQNIHVLKTDMNNNDVIKLEEHIKYNKKRKIEKKTFEIKSSNYKEYDIEKLYNMINYINNMFTLYLRKFNSSIINDLKIYAFYNNLFALYSYVHDYIHRINKLSMYNKKKKNEINDHYNIYIILMRQLYLLKENIKQFIILTIKNNNTSYFKNVQNLFNSYKDKLEVNYSFFQFSENEKLLEIIYIIINKISNKENSFYLHIMNNNNNNNNNNIINMNKNKREKLLFYIKNDKELNEKYAFLNILKIKGCIKILTIIIKYYLIKYDKDNLNFLQNYFLILLLIPHFELSIYKNVLKKEYIKLFHWSHVIDGKGNNKKDNNKKYKLANINHDNNNDNNDDDGYDDDGYDDDNDNDDVNDYDDDFLQSNNRDNLPSNDNKSRFFNEADNSKFNIHKNHSLYYQKLKFKVAYSLCHFDDEVTIYSNKESFSNIHILVEYSRLVYKYLQYINKKSNAKNNSFLFINLSYFVKYIFDCVTNIYFSQSYLNNNKVGIKECNEKIIENNSGNYYENNLYITGKPYIIFYNSKLKNIFSTYNNIKKSKYKYMYKKEDYNKNEIKDNDDNDNTNSVVHLFCMLNKKKKKKNEINIYLNYLIFTNQLNLINIINFDINPCTFIVSTLFSFIKRINENSFYFNLSTFNNKQVYNFTNHIINNILEIYINIFEINGFLNFIHKYIGNYNAPYLRQIHFLFTPIYISIFNKYMHKFTDKYSSFLLSFIEIYKFHINEFNKLHEKIFLSLKNNEQVCSTNKCFKIEWEPMVKYPKKCNNTTDNNSNNNIIQINGYNYSISQLIQRYQVMYTNLETLEYILCCYLRCTYKNYITNNLLNNIQNISNLYIQKKQNILTFHEYVKGNFINMKYYNFYYSLYVYIFFNYTISRLALYSLLNDQINLKHTKQNLHIIINKLHNCFVDIQVMYEHCVKESAVYKFFDILQVTLETLYFYIYFSDWHIMDKDAIIKHFKEIIGVLQKNALEEYSYVIKKRIYKHISYFFIYNYKYLIKIFNDKEGDIENIYVQIIKTLFIDINIIKNENSYLFFYELYVNIKENEKLSRLLTELFTLHYILIINNLENEIMDAQEKQKLNNRKKIYRTNNENKIDYIKKKKNISMSFDNYINLLIKQNSYYMYTNNWYEVFNVNQKIILQNNVNDNYENKMIDIFLNNNNMNINKYDINLYYYNKNEQNNDNINIDVCILSKFFVLFNNIEYIQDTLYTLLCKIFDNFTKYNIYFEYILINILLCFINNLQNIESSKRKINIETFIKFSMLIFKKQKDCINNNDTQNYKNKFVLKLFFHIFFIYINIYYDEQNISNNVSNQFKDDKEKDILNHVNKNINKKINKSKVISKKLEISFNFFIKYFLLTHSIIMNEQDNKQTNITDENISYLLNNMKSTNCHTNSDTNNDTNNDTQNNHHLFISTKTNCDQELLNNMKCFLEKIIMNSSEQKNNIIIQTNRFFLDLIEYVFFSFSIDIEKIQKTNYYTKGVQEIRHIFNNNDIQQIFLNVHEEYKHFIYIVYILNVFNMEDKAHNIKNKKSVHCDEVVHCDEAVHCDETVHCDEAIHCDEAVHCDETVHCDKAFHNDEITSIKKPKRNIINTCNLTLFNNLFFYKNSSGVNTSVDPNKANSIIIYDFIFNYNKILVECDNRNMVYFCLKCNDIIKIIVTLLDYTTEDVEHILKYIDTQIAMKYKDHGDMRNFLYLCNLHIITLIYIISNNKKFLSQIILMKHKLNNILYFINIYFHLNEYIQIYLENFDEFKTSQQLFLLLHLMYKLSQLFTYFFVKLKLKRKNINFFFFRKKHIIKSNDMNERKGASKHYITHFYILNNPSILEKKKFYLYLLGHQLYNILYEFFNIKKNEKIVKSQKTVMEVMKKSGYAIKFLCSYLDCVLYLGNRINKLLLRNVYFFMNFLKNNKNTLKLANVIFPILIKVVDIYDVLTKKTTLNEEEFEEKQILKNIFQASLSIIEERSIQFCFTSLSEKKKELFNLLSN